jgi:ornithine--oxo-acid transaminase
VFPVSAFLSSTEVMDVFNPGDHGSTFGGNPLGCAVAAAALDVLVDEKLVERSATLGPWFMDQLRAMNSPHVREVRGVGLFVGVELDKPARSFCEALRERGVLAKETHTNVIRFAPPLVVTREDLKWALPKIREVLR